MTQISTGSKVKCCECDQMAVWIYAPTTERNDIMFCEDHVPRGCSCVTLDLVEYDLSEEQLTDYDSEGRAIDDKGRLLPCVEYWLCGDGFDESDFK